MLESTPVIEVPVTKIYTTEISMVHFRDTTLMEILELIDQRGDGLDVPEGGVEIPYEGVVSAEDMVKLSPESFPAIAEHIKTVFCLPSFRVIGNKKFAVNSSDLIKSGMLSRMLVEYRANKVNELQKVG